MGSFNPFGRQPRAAPIVVPRTPAPPAPAPVMTEESTQEDVSQAQEEQRQRRRTQRGRAATILSGRSGTLGDDSAGLATKTLLGG